MSNSTVCIFNDKCLWPFIHFQHYCKPFVIAHAHRTKSPQRADPHSVITLCFYSQHTMNRVVVREANCLARSLLSSTLKLNGINFVWVSVLFYSSSGYTCQVSLIVLGQVPGATHFYLAIFICVQTSPTAVPLKNGLGSKLIIVSFSFALLLNHTHTSFHLIQKFSMFLSFN